MGAVLYPGRSARSERTLCMAVCWGIFDVPPLVSYNPQVCPESTSLFRGNAKVSTVMTRVFVTGMGALTPIGNDVPTYWENLVAGKSGAGRITLFDTLDMPYNMACEVKG
ncbi:MAG: beta-ketoacyl synthase N-terminal-like domain-containing protein, partial [Caldilineaceae bacterium]